jgi:hypothetical protein
VVFISMAEIEISRICKITIIVYMEGEKHFPGCTELFRMCGKFLCSRENALNQ